MLISQSETTKSNAHTFPKALVYLLLVVSPWVNDTFATDCSEAEITLSSQAQVDGIRGEIDNCPVVANTNGDDGGNALEADSLKDQQSELVMNFSFSGEMDRICRGVGKINGVILALVQVQEYGCELWRINPDGVHELFADINAGEASSDITYNFGRGALFEGWYYFGAYDEVNKNRLWRTDGVNLERVAETEPVPNGFERQGISPIHNGFKGRNYFMAWQTGQPRDNLYSTDGNTLRAEPPPPLADNARIAGHHTLFDKMIVTTQGYGHEPWIFDGTEYQLLGDLYPGIFGPLFMNLWFYFDEAWVFHADVSNDLGNRETAFFYTDGNRVIKLPHKGKSFINSFNALSAFIYTREFQYAVGTTLPDSETTGIPVLRISKDASSDYELTTPPDKVTGGSGAILNDNAFILANNRLFKLGETSAEEEAFVIPTDWEDSVFRFVGTNAYFYDAYIKETNPQNDSRVWVWNSDTVGLLMTDETHTVTNADFFWHIGNDIYFYGEDHANGWALRKIPGVVIERLPPLAKVTGSWYDPATSGQGFVLHPIDDKRTVYSFYGFENDGSPLWLTGVGSTELETGKPITVNMMVSSGGNFGSFTPDAINEKFWGTLEITFETCSKATASFDGLSGQQTMNMVLLTGVEGIDCFYTENPPKPKTAGITGSWYDPSTSGQGLLLHSMSDEQMVVSFYGYNNNSERMWLIGLYTGQVAWDKPLELMMTTASGGRFGGFTPENIAENLWGTLTINFADCQNAIATLNGTDGQQIMNMVKLAGLQGSDFDCH